MAGIPAAFRRPVTVLTLAAMLATGCAALAIATPQHAYAAELAGINAGAPSAPTTVKMSAKDKAFTVSWLAPTDTGSSKVVGYQIDYSTDPTFASGVKQYNVGLVSFATVSGLAEGTTYYARVAAKNASGYGAKSAIVSAQTYGVPGAPTGVRAGSGTGSVTVRWTAPVNKGGLTLGNYLVQLSTDASFATVDRQLSPLPSAVTTTFVGLSPVTQYYARVIATNSFGSSTPSATVTATTPALTPATPAAPSVTATAGTSMNVSWTAPADQGSPITGYTVQYSTDASFSSGVGVIDAAATSTSLTGLSAGATYYVRVAAVNGVGSSSFSPASSAVVADVPGRPTSLSVTSVNYNTASLAWGAPASDGGSPITGYRVIQTAGPAVNGIAVNGLGATVYGPFQPRAFYNFTVVAINAVGESVASFPAGFSLP